MINMRDRQFSTRPVIWVALVSVAITASMAGAQTFTLISNPTPEIGDFFGIHVAAVGTDKVLIGAPGDDTKAPNAGAAYLFDLEGNWLRTFHSPDPVEDEFFGRWLIGVGANRVLISAIQDEDAKKGKPTLPGTAYLFDLDGTLVQTFTNPNPSIADVFGVSAALDPNTLVIGSPGDDTDAEDAGKVFQFQIGVKDPVQEFSDPPPEVNHGLGFPIAALGLTRFVVGAEGANNDAGELHVFDIDSGLVVSTMQHPDPTFTLPTSVDALGTDKVLVGSEGFEVNGKKHAGGAFIFDVLTGALELTIPNPEPEFDDAFGISVAALGTSAFVVAADLDNPGGINDAGTVYLYDDTGLLRETLNSPTASEGDQFGFALDAIDGDTIVVGVPQGDSFDFVVGPGEAYIIAGLSDEIDFDPPEEFIAVGEPIVQAVADFTDDATNDVIVTVPGDDPRLDGAVQVFLNQGLDEFGEWLGLASIKPITVGREPSGVAIGLFNDDAFVDFAVTNAGDNTVLVFINQGMGDATFNPPVSIDVGQRPSAVIAGDFNDDGFVDLAVANADDNNVWLLFNDGDAVFTKGGTLGSMGMGPIGLDPEDLDNDKDLDIVGINGGIGGIRGGLPGSVFVLINEGGGTFAAAVTYEIGVGPADLATGDLNRDDFAEIVAVNTTDATISILVNQRDGTFMAGDDLLVGDSPVSIDTVDLDADLDLDLAVVAVDIKIGLGIQVLQNIGINIGDLVFEEPVAFGVDADPNFVVNTDFNNDGVFDLVTVNADEGKTGGSVTALINIQCPWDLDDNEVVGASDLLSLLVQWGTDPGGPPDFDGDGNVGASDLLVLLANWGLCP
ncbi:MAG: FG-GAP-like repeat-containing protein [Phycisphaerales bacterium]